MSASRAFPSGDGGDEAGPIGDTGDDGGPGPAVRPWWGRGPVVAGLIATAAFVLGGEAAALAVLALAGSSGRPVPVVEAPAVRDEPARADAPAPVAVPVAAAPAPAAEAPATPPEPDGPLGYRLFVRDWLPDDPRCHGGDGLGPLYNATSCVACHDQGGVGGSGPRGRNVDLLVGSNGGTVNVGGMDMNLIVGPELTAEGHALLGRLHPGLRDATTTSLHRSSTDPDYEAWRAALLGYDPAGAPATGGRPWPIPAVGGCSSPTEIKTVAPDHFEETALGRDLLAGIRDAQGAAAPHPRGRHQTVRMPTEAEKAEALRQVPVTLLLSRRNPPALFGSGRIDAVPEADILANAERSHAAHPEVSGRPARVAGGKLGRFGWKGQVASLDDFVASACASELGLEVPGHHQAHSPKSPDAPARGLDMTGAECEALVDYVRRLPAPAASATRRPDESQAAGRGREVFASVGCAGCHTPDLGPARGIYSDLLLHDMGVNLADNGTYSAVEPDAAGSPALATEWRTPPLWGLRDSGPYLHDGRARTVEEAVAMHGGEAERVARRYFELGGPERMDLDAFLMSLVAPARVDQAPAAVASAAPAPGPAGAWVEAQSQRLDDGLRLFIEQTVADLRSAADARAAAQAPAPEPPPAAARRAAVAARPRDAREQLLEANARQLAAAEMLRNARNQSRMGNAPGALLLLRRVAQDWPETPQGREARQELARLMAPPLPYRTRHTTRGVATPLPSFGFNGWIGAGVAPAGR